MDQPLPNFTPRRERKACTECRQQKTKCDVYLDQSKPCSRCRKLRHECIVSEPFRRENKRQKLSVLERETTQLRQQLSSLKSQELTPISSNSSSSAINKDHAAHDRTGNGATQSGVLRKNNQVYNTTPPSSTSRVPYTSASETLDRTLDGLKVEAHEIDDMFQLYFSDFAHYLPILDSSRQPNEYYDLSSTLFWAIIGAASRAYTKNSVLLDALRKRVQNLAIDSLKLAATLEGVQALLLVVTWPFPKGGATLNPTFSLSGALIHVAMSVGLHMPAAGQEFSKFRIKLTEEDVRQRAETWAYCVIMYQRSVMRYVPSIPSLLFRTCLFKGNSSVILTDVCQDPAQRHMLFQKLSSATMFRLKLQDSIARLTKSLAENGLQDMSAEQERTLEILIQAFQNDIDNLRLEAISPYNELDIAMACLTIQTFYLFRSPESYTAVPIIRIFTYACLVMSKLEYLAISSSSGYKTTTFYYAFAMMLASMVLLRLYKIPNLAKYIDTDTAKSKISYAIDILELMSLDTTDTVARMIVVIRQTLGSEKAFKHPSGTEIVVPLRIRSRYALSIILDGVMWWREEFGGNTGVFPAGVFPVPLATSKDAQDEAITDYIPTAATNTDMESHGQMNNPNDYSIYDPAWTHFDDMFSPFWAETAGWTNFIEQ